MQSAMAAALHVNSADLSMKLEREDSVGAAGVGGRVVASLVGTSGVGAGAGVAGATGHEL